MLRGGLGTPPFRRRVGGVRTREPPPPVPSACPCQHGGFSGHQGAAVGGGRRPEALWDGQRSHGLLLGPVQPPAGEESPRRPAEAQGGAWRPAGARESRLDERGVWSPRLAFSSQCCLNCESLESRALLCPWPAAARPAPKERMRGGGCASSPTPALRVGQLTAARAPRGLLRGVGGLFRAAQPCPSFRPLSPLRGRQVSEEEIGLWSQELWGSLGRSLARALASRAALRRRASPRRVTFAPLVCGCDGHGTCRTASSAGRVKSVQVRGRDCTNVRSYVQLGPEGSVSRGPTSR